MEDLRQQLEMLRQQVSVLVSRERPIEAVSRTQDLPASAWMRSPQSNPDVSASSASPVQQLLMNQSPTNSRDLQRNGPMNSKASQPAATGPLSITDVTDSSFIDQSNAVTNQTSTSGKLAVAYHPLLSLSPAEAMRLVDVYEDECGSVYPLIDIEHLRHFVTQFYDSVTASRKPATWRTFKLDQSSKRHFNTLEIVMAIALVIEGRGATDLSTALMDELEAEIDHRPSGVSADNHLAEILTLMSFYQFYRDEEVLAWRTIGLAARIALEIGLHLRDPPFATFKSTQERELANRLFWCIYCLDRRWSFGTGLPFGIQEDDIDPSLLEPEDSPPYLFTSMIAHSRIGSKILKAFSGSEHLELPGKREETAFLKYQVQQWYISLTPELRIDQHQELVLADLSPARNRLRILNCLRKNQLLMMIHRRSLFAETSIVADPQAARTAVDLAKSTINLLDRLGKTSEIYNCHAACFNYFLYSALIVILLAAYHAKAQFHEYCRMELHLALNLIGGISSKSNIARKLWKIIKHLKVTIPDTGILNYMETQQENPGQERNTLIQENPTASAHQSELFNTTNMHVGRGSTTAAELDGTRNSIAYVEPDFYSDDYAVDGSMLSSELSDLFHAIDPTRSGQTPLQLFEQQNPSQPSTFHMSQPFPKDIRTVF
ncbi:uncharacterized protein A1O9_04063 [Exophiala aquamarina CBS 119918]|uniref:Xylanolytic transcriptional activator regulatory domain-containing protein n=1 Tax=Exophiala aquamarina CBS 119918 TaxID=1182545 RepID=A0A072PGH5_9EURO|nr:uncharacterized protein A1O9_04063 [Exophiala aquamarina CBS 119918]KEF59219.1 hypothetical protein A1O9_04063 [Exophiala aquamarina CBS 119918]